MRRTQSNFPPVISFVVSLLLIGPTEVVRPDILRPVHAMAEATRFDQQAMSVQPLFSGGGLGRHLPVRKLLSRAAMAVVAAPSLLSSSMLHASTATHAMAQAVRQTIALPEPFHESFKQGWSVWRYAKANGTTVDSLLSWNSWIKNPRAIPIGHDVIIPKLHTLTLPGVPDAPIPTMTEVPLGWQGVLLHSAQNTLAWLQNNPLESIGILLFVTALVFLARAWPTRRNNPIRLLMKAPLLALLLLIPVAHHHSEIPKPSAAVESDSTSLILRPRGTSAWVRTEPGARNTSHMTLLSPTSKPTGNNPTEISAPSLTYTHGIFLGMESDGKVAIQHDAIAKSIEFPDGMPGMTMRFDIDPVLRPRFQNLPPKSEIYFATTSDFRVTALRTEKISTDITKHPEANVEEIIVAQDPVQGEKLLRLAQSTIDSALHITNLTNQYQEASLDQQHAALRPGVRVGVYARVENSVFQAGPQAEFKTTLPGSPAARDLARRTVLQATLSQVDLRRTAAQAASEWLNAYLSMEEAQQEESDSEKLLSRLSSSDQVITSILEERRLQAKSKEMVAARDLLKASGMASKGIQAQHVIDWSKNVDSAKVIGILQPYINSRVSPAVLSADTLREAMIDLQGRSQERLTPLWRKLILTARYPAPWWNVLQVGWMRSAAVDWEQLAHLCFAAEEKWRIERYQAYENASATLVQMQESSRLANTLRNRVDRLTQEADLPTLAVSDQDRLWTEVSELAEQAHAANTQADQARVALHLWGINPDTSVNELAPIIQQMYSAELDDTQSAALELAGALEKKKSAKAAVLIKELKRLEKLGQESLRDSDLQQAPSAGDSQGMGSVDPSPPVDVQVMTTVASEQVGAISQAPDAPVIPGGPVTVTAQTQITGAYTKRSIKELTFELRRWRRVEEENQARTELTAKHLNAEQDTTQVADLDAVIASLHSELSTPISPARRAECEGLLATRQAERRVRQARLNADGRTSDFVTDAPYEAAMAHYTSALVSAEIAHKSVNAWTLMTMVQSAGNPTRSSYLMSAFDPGKKLNDLVGKLIHHKPRRAEVYMADKVVELARLDVADRFFSILQIRNAAQAASEENEPLIDRLNTEIEDTSQSGDVLRQARAVSERAEAVRYLHEAQQELVVMTRELAPFQTFIDIPGANLSKPMATLRLVLSRLQEGTFDRGTPPSVARTITAAAVQQGFEAFIPSGGEGTFALFGSLMHGMDGNTLNSGALFNYEWSPGETRRRQDSVNASAADTSVIAFETILANKKYLKELEIQARVQKGLNLSLEKWASSSDLGPDAKVRAHVIATRARLKAQQAASQLGISFDSIHAIMQDDPITLPYMQDPTGTTERVASRCACGNFEDTRDPSTLGERRFQWTPFIGMSGAGIGFSLWERRLLNDPVAKEKAVWKTRESVRNAQSKLNTTSMRTRLLAQNAAIEAEGSAWEASRDTLNAMNPSDDENVLLAMQRVYDRLGTLLVEIHARQIPDLSTLDPNQWEPNGILIRTVGPGYFRQVKGAPSVPLHRTFKAKGIVQRVDPDASEVVIKHEPIPGYMEKAMTMVFSVDSQHRDLLKDLKPGQPIGFTLEVLSDQIHITQITSSDSITSPKSIPPSNDDSWSLQTLDGKTVHADEFRGKVLFINRWATWCPPCRAEMDSIARLRERYRGRDDIAFLLITDEDPKSVREFLKDHPSYRDIYFVNEKTASLFEASSIPMTLIVDSSGQMIRRVEGAQRWDSKRFVRQLDKLLGKKPVSARRQDRRWIDRAA